MSKYHKGDKFIVEIKEVINSDNGTLYRSDFKTLTFDDNGLDKLQKYNGSIISEDTLEMERMKALNDGRNEAWECAKECFSNMKEWELEEVFGKDWAFYKIMEMSPQEALAKLEAYEKEQNQIKVGDVVKNGNGETEFVVIATSEETINGQPILRPIGKTLIKGVIFASDTDLKKTGKHIDIQSLLEQIKE